MGVVPGNKSMANSISRLGGSPGNSWKTSGKSRTTGISSRFGPLVSLTSTVHRYALHPLLISLQALVDEIRGIVEVKSPPLYCILSPSLVIRVRIF